MRRIKKNYKIQPRYNVYSFQTWLNDNKGMLKEMFPTFNFKSATLNDYYTAFEELYIEHTADSFC